MLNLNAKMVIVVFVDVKKPVEGGVKYKDGKDPLGYIEFDDEGNPLDILPCISKIDIKSLKVDKDGIGRITF